MKIIFFIFFLFITNFTNSQTPIQYLDMTIDENRRPFQKAGIPLIADLDRDGQKEILFVVLDYNGIANPPLLLFVTNSDGTNYGNFPKGYNELIYDIASGDVNGDGFLDIAIRFTHSFTVIDRFGKTLAGFPINYSEDEIVAPRFISLYDLDNDGMLEIIVSRFGDISIYNYDGSLRNGWPRKIPGKAIYNPAIGDLDGDGYGDMVINTFKFINNTIDSGGVQIFKHNGENFSNNFPIYFDSLYNSWSSSPSLFINSDNLDSSYFTIVLDNLGSGGLGFHKFLKLNFKGNILSQKYYSTYMDYGTLIMGDIDKNGEMDFATGTQYGVTFSAFNNILNRYPGSWPNSGQGEHWATGMIGKLTFGNNLNVITNTWNTFNPNGYGFIYAYTPDGNNLPWSPLRPKGLVNAISLADLNNDGSVELIATSRSANEGFLHIWTFPGIPFTYEDFPWPQYGHDRYRTNQHGFIPPDEPVGIQPMNTNVPASFNLYQNFPNPFNPSTRIKFDIAKSGNVKLVVFDMLGREVSTLINENLNPGTYQVSFDGSNFSSGVYFYQLQGEGYLNTMKMIMIK